MMPIYANIITSLILVGETAGVFLVLGIAMLIESKRTYRQKGF